MGLGLGIRRRHNVEFAVGGRRRNTNEETTEIGKVCAWTMLELGG